jgi:hypothetical protein
MDHDTREALLLVFGLTDESVDSIEADADVHSCLKQMVQECSTNTFHHLVQAADMEAQAADAVAEGQPALPFSLPRHLLCTLPLHLCGAPRCSQRPIGAEEWAVCMQRSGWRSC